MGSRVTRARKKATNLSVSADLLAMARRRKINLSTTLEAALREKLKAESHQEWLSENERALEEYARHVGASGVFSDGLRRF